MSLYRLCTVLLVLTAALSAPSSLFAQGVDVPKVTVFGGYSWYHAGGTVNGVAEPSFNKGWAGQFSYTLSHWAGLTLDGTGHYNDVASAHTIAIGPQFKFRGEHVTPFLEVLLGMQDFAPKTLSSQTAATLIGGGGLDYQVNPRISIRAFQFDYVNSYYDRLSVMGKPNNFNGARLQAGLVFNFGLPAEESNVLAGCSAEPQVVNVGAPVTISVTPSGFLPKRTLSYSYSSNGGQISGNTTSATLDTAGVASGSYTASVTVTDNGKGKHRQTASCQVAFVVREMPKYPPVVSISASPTSVVSGESSMIAVTASSPDRRPMKYNCASSAGTLTGNGLTYVLNTAGVPDSTVTINCTVSDDRSLSVSAAASVKVNVPAPPSANHFRAIEFKNDVKRPTRVDNQAKGELDRYADALAADPGSKGVLVGYATAKEDAPARDDQSTSNFEAQRAVNSKDYLTKEKGIDPTRIETRTGHGDEQKVELWIVPAGAVFSANGTTVVDEARVKAVPRISAKPKRKVHRKAHRKVAQKK